MREKNKFYANEIREELFLAAEYRSVVSGLPLLSGTPMLAHRVAKTRGNLEKWGSEVINHPLNLVPVLDLKENDACNIANRRNEAHALLERIVRVNTGRESMPDMADFYRELRDEFREKQNQ